MDEPDCLTHLLHLRIFRDYFRRHRPFRKSPLIEEPRTELFDRVHDVPLVDRENVNGSTYRGNVP